MLITLPDGSHRNVPAPQHIAPDLEAMLGARRVGRADGEVEMPDYVEIDLGGGLFFYRYDLRDGRGNFVQDGSFEVNGNDFSDGDLIWDKSLMGRNSYLAGSSASVLMTNPLGARLSGDEFLGVPLMMGAHNVLYRDDGTEVLGVPVITAVAGFSGIVPAGASFALCCKTVPVNGAPTFWIGWNAATGNALQVLTTLGNPPINTTVPVGPYPISGLCPTPIDSDACVIYGDDAIGGLIRRIACIPALGTVLPEDSLRLPPYGYTVGLVALEGSADVFHVVPNDASSVLGLGTGPWTYGWKGKLLRHDLRASYGPQEVRVQLPFIRWATGGANTIFYCAGGREHRLLARGSDIPVPGSDRPPAVAGNIKIECVGHSRLGDKWWWTENEVDQAGLVNTKMRRFEYDAALNRAWPVTPKIDMGGTGIRSMGGHDMPYSRPNGNLVEYSTAGWRYQHQPHTGILGNSQIHVDGAGAASGRYFTASSSRTTPKLRPRGHHNPMMVMARVTGPTLSWLRRGTASPLTPAGIAEGLTASECKIEISGNGLPETIVFKADEVAFTEDYRPVYTMPATDDWQPFLQLTFTAYRGTSGANAAHYTPVVDRITVEGYFYDRPVPVASSQYSRWGANTEAPSDTLTA
jgi:hypothetical protein